MLHIERNPFHLVSRFERDNTFCTDIILRVVMIRVVEVVSTSVFLKQNVTRDLLSCRDGKHPSRPLFGLYFISLGDHAYMLFLSHSMH